MNKNYKISTLLFVCFLAGMTACSQNKPTPDEGEQFVEEEITYERVKSVTNEGYYLVPGEERTITVDYESLNKNYLKLVLKTDVNVYGAFNYVNVDDSSETGRESFYVEASEEKQELTHFLDAYRPEFNTHSGCHHKVHEYYDIPFKTKMAQGLFSKKITNIKIKNVSEEAGTVNIIAFYVSDRNLPQEEVYLTKGHLKIGVDLMGGGTFTYLERLNYKTSKDTYYIDEIVTPDNDVYIGVNASQLVGEEGVLGSVDHHVNLINYYDAGRQFQQSFYAGVGGSNQSTNGENGYTRTMCWTSGTPNYWPYNPVQGGDVHCNISQVVDYKRTGDTIYIKCKALDWACNNSVTDSYTENWYSIEDDCVFVKNRFINFAGFENMENCNKTQLELPAAYVVHPFNNYVTYQGETPWTDDQAGLIYNSNLGSWAERADIVNKHLEDWFAWLNSDGFGVGVYIPDVSFYASGRDNASVAFSYKHNQNAYTSPMGDSEKLRYNKQECTYSFQSCYVGNTCYTAPEIITTMLDYIPFEYSYALCVDYLPVIRNNFKHIYENNGINNETMFAWDKKLEGKL